MIKTIKTHSNHYTIANVLPRNKRTATSFNRHKNRVLVHYSTHYVLYGVQHRATKMIVDYKFLNYEDRLVRTGLTTLEERRSRGDLIEVFKMIKGLNKSDYTRFFSIVSNNRTRGHKFKIVKNRSRSNIRKKFLQSEGS